MSRLTKRLGDQVIIKDIGVTDCKKVCDSMDEYDNPCDMCIIDEVFRKLAHYEDLEEQGRLIELPCKVGEKVWLANGVHEPWQTTYTRIHQIISDVLCGWAIGHTKEEAEAKLAELKGTEE